MTRDETVELILREIECNYSNESLRKQAGRVYDALSAANLLRGEDEPGTIDELIGLWSMRPQPGTPAGEVWEHGCRQGYQWGLERRPQQAGESVGYMCNVNAPGCDPDVVSEPSPAAKEGLLPCPFCGGPAETAPESMHVFCECGAEVCAFALSEAKAQWNRRATARGGE